MYQLHGANASTTSSSSSSFCGCPFCGKSIAMVLLTRHIDLEHDDTIDGGEIGEMEKLVEEVVVAESEEAMIARAIAESELEAIEMEEDREREIAIAFKKSKKYIVERRKRKRGVNDDDENKKNDEEDDEEVMIARILKISQEEILVMVKNEEEILERVLKESSSISSALNVNGRRKWGEEVIYMVSDEDDEQEGSVLKLSAASQMSPSQISESQDILPLSDVVQLGNEQQVEDDEESSMGKRISLRISGDSPASVSRSSLLFSSAVERESDIFSQEQTEELTREEEREKWNQQEDEERYQARIEQHTRIERKECLEEEEEEEQQQQQQREKEVQCKKEKEQQQQKRKKEAQAKKLQEQEEKHQQDEEKKRLQEEGAMTRSTAAAALFSPSPSNNNNNFNTSTPPPITTPGSPPPVKNAFSILMTPAVKEVMILEQVTSSSKSSSSRSSRSHLPQYRVKFSTDVEIPSTSALPSTFNLQYSGKTKYEVLYSNVSSTQLSASSNHLVSNTSHISVSCLKSILQKNIRRKRPMPAGKLKLASNKNTILSFARLSFFSIICFVVCLLFVTLISITIMHHTPPFHHLFDAKFVLRRSSLQRNGVISYDVSL